MQFQRISSSFLKHLLVRKMEELYSLYHWIFTRRRDSNHLKTILLHEGCEDFESGYGSADFNANYLPQGVSGKSLFEDEPDTGVLLFEQLKLAVISQADIDKIEDLVEKCPLLTDPSTSDTLVHLAIRHENLSALNYFLSLNIFKLNELKVLQLLSNVLLCSDKYIFSILQILVENGVNIECKLDQSINSFAHLCGSNLKSSGFTIAVQSLIKLGYGHLFLVRNKLDQTPLHVAVMAGMDVEMAALEQISSKCNFNFNERYGPEGNPFLHHVARWSQTKNLAENVIRLGGDWTLLNKYSKSVVHCAVAGRSLEMLEYFLELGCSVKCQDFLGRTPLHHLKFAREENLLEMTTLLLEYGGDLYAVDDAGSSVYGQVSRKFNRGILNSWNRHLKSLGYSENMLA